MMGRVLCLCSVAVLVVAIGCVGPEPVATDQIGRGRQLYKAMNCGSCHEAPFFGLGRPVGPPLDAAGRIAAERVPGMSAVDYLRQAITDPGAHVVPGYPDSMPRGVGAELSAEDLAALVAYLASLK